MENTKWLAVFLLMATLNLAFLIVFLTATVNELREACPVTTGRIVKDPFASPLKKYLVKKEIASTGKVVIEMSVPNHKINITIYVARNRRIPLAFPPQMDIPTLSGQLRREPSISDSAMSVDVKNNAQNGNEIVKQISSSQMTTLSEVNGLSARVKRDHTTDSETTTSSMTTVVRKSSTPFSQTTLLQNFTGSVIEEATIPQTTPAEELSTPSGRSVREALTPFPESQEVTTSTDQVEKEASTPLSQTTLLSESTTASSRVPRKASKGLGLSEKEKTTIKNIYRVLRALSTPVEQTTEVKNVATLGDGKEHSTTSELNIKQDTTISSIHRLIREATTTTQKENLMQEVTTPKGEDNTEQSTLDQNLSTTNPPRIVRDAPTLAKASMNKEVTRPSGRIFREALIQNQMNVGEESIPSIHKKPVLKEKKLMEGFFKETISAIIGELEQVKLEAMKKISKHNDDPTFPPQTDPEGTDF
ncbi:unnamed protein product [Nezara viridula]|uniref:Uncharacterized protein n=1 Tax=Nezara viridula TaxID=85310 RepID=A0A9P0HF20_NEZVI|nr:unnamed protein product [Nezara viridula]